MEARPADPDEAVLLDVDGETPGRLPARFAVLPGAAVAVFSPSQTGMLIYQTGASAEAALWESKQLLTNAIDRAPIGMLMVAPEGQFIQVNHAKDSIISV